MRRLALAAALVVAVLATAVRYSDSPWALLDEGGNKGPVYSLNFIGDAISCSASGGVGTCTVDAGTSGGGLDGTPEAIYHRASSQTLTSGSSTIVNFDVVDTDTDSAVTTGASWKFTVPVGKGGSYEVSAVADVNYGASTTYDQFESIYVNGAEVRRGPRVTGSLPGPAGNYTAGAHVLGVVRLSAGDYVDVRVWETSGFAASLVGFAQLNYIAIRRVR